MGEKRRLCNIFFWKLEGKGQYGKSLRTWEANIKIDLKRNVSGLNELTQNKFPWRGFVNTVMNFGVSGKNGYFLTT